VRVVCSGRGVVLTAALLALLVLAPLAGLVHYIYFERSRLPDLEGFITRANFKSRTLEVAARED